MTRLKKMRLEKRMRLREVSQKLKITPQTVQQMEHRGIKTIPTAKRYAAALGVAWADVIDE